ncbi:MAG: ArnT family glycosyltransferase, partial [Nitrospiraceae bacterium]
SGMSQLELRQDGMERQGQGGASWGTGISGLPQSRVVRWGIPSLLLICGLILLFYRLDQRALYESMEARYPLAVLMMEIRDNWMVPYRRGAAWMFKPPLNVWLIHLAGLVWGGIDEWTARFPSASATLGTVMLIFWWGKRLGGTLFGGIAGFVLLTSGHFLIMGRTSFTDQVFTFFFTLSLVAFYAVYHRWWGERAWWLMYAAMGLATMAKGPMGLLLSIAVILTYLAIEKDLSALYRMRWISGLMIYAAITLPWYLGVFLLYGVSPWPGLFDILWSYQPSMKGLQRLPWYYYGFYCVTFPLSFAPWSLFLPGLAAVWRRYRNGGNGIPPALRFAAIWFLVIFVAFSLANTPHRRRPYYVLPILPPASLMIAYVWQYLISAGKESAQWFHRYLQVICSILLALGIGVVIIVALGGFDFAWPFVEVTQPLVASVALTLLPLVLLVAVREVRRRRYLRTFGALAVAFFWLWLWAIRFYEPTLDSHRSAQVIGASLRQLLPKESEVWLYGFFSDTISFYFGRDMRPIANLAPLDRRVTEDAPLYFLAEERAVRDILTRYAGRVVACGSYSYSGRELMLVLLTNRSCHPTGGGAFLPRTQVSRNDILRGRRSIRVESSSTSDATKLLSRRSP